MRKILVVVLLVLFLSSCMTGRFLPPTPTVAPTQTALPTYTPMPTYTPYPTLTPVLPTEVPIDILGYQRVDCGVTNWPSGVSDGICYTYSDGNGVGIIFLGSGGYPITIGVTWLVTSDAAYDAGLFIGAACVAAGWNKDDAGNAVNNITQQGAWAVFGSMQARAVLSDDGLYMSVYVKPAGASL